MTSVAHSEVMERLKTVAGPDFLSDIVSLGLVSDIVTSDGKVFFSLTIPPERAKELESLRITAERVIREIPGVTDAFVTLTADKKGGRTSDDAPQARSIVSQKPVTQAHTDPIEKVSSPQRLSQHGQLPHKLSVPGVNAIITIASGKGGVGKSTTAVNLALGLQANGLKIGILDADIYGPSMPRLLGIRGRPEIVSGRILKPMENYGIKVMSIGFLVNEETPMIWRGPMVISALTQMLREVEWGKLDILVIDMPPGTGDAQLTIAQKVPLAGAVIISTPQDLALIDARRGLHMFRKVDVPLLGIIENMSYFIAPDTGKRYDIFGHGGACKEAHRLGVPFLGEIPLHMEIRATSDTGTPIVVAEPNNIHAKIYRDIAAKIWKDLEIARIASSRAKITPANHGT